MKKGQKDSGDKNKKKGWGARLMSLIAGSSDEELAPSDDDQDDAPRGKGGHASAPKFVQQVEPAPVDSRAALKKMLKDPEQKKVLLVGFFQQYRVALTLLLQEVYEFAEYLGMDVDQDQEFLWIAVEAMFAPLPRNWQEFENEQGQIYYYNHRFVRVPLCSCVLGVLIILQHKNKSMGTSFG